MPYIDRERRSALNKGVPPATPGELAYLLFREAVEYLRYNNPRNTGSDGANYEERSAVLGVLESVKHEFARQYLDRYEDTKKEINGDV